jgi:hypothetical protein
MENARGLDQGPKATQSGEVKNRAILGISTPGNANAMWKG